MEPIVVRTKSEMAFDALRDMILSGAIEQKRIYSIAELAEMLQISRTPLAKAVSRLEEQGVVELVAKAGIRVLPLRASDLEEHSHLVTQVAKLVVQWVITRCPKEQILSLNEYVDDIRAAIAQQRQGPYFTASRDFYLAMCDLAHATHCRRFFEQNWNYEGWYCYSLAQNQRALLDLLSDHQALIAAMAEGDTPRALQVCQVHADKCISLLSRYTGDQTRA